MLQSRSASASHASLSALDITVSTVFHLLILAAVLAFGLWHRQPRDFHFISVKVHLVSAHQLKRLQHPAHLEKEHHTPAIKPKPVVKPRPKPVVKPKPKPVVKPKPKLAVKPKPKPVVKPKPKPAAKHKPKLAAKHKPALKLKQKLAIKHKRRPKPKVEDNFNPFKPIESTTDIKSAPVTSSKAAQVFQGQLSTQEINRYIALIQEAVQRHWKVPNIGGDVRNPLVKMVLNPDGSVRAVRILESSGNMALDASLIRAIEAAGPFQVPREQFELFRNNKIRFHPLR